MNDYPRQNPAYRPSDFISQKFQDADPVTIHIFILSGLKNGVLILPQRHKIIL